MKIGHPLTPKLKEANHHLVKVDWATILKNVWHTHPFLLVNELYIVFSFYRHVRYSKPFREIFITILCLPRGYSWVTTWDVLKVISLSIHSLVWLKLAIFKTVISNSNLLISEYQSSRSVFPLTQEGRNTNLHPFPF